MGMLMQSKAKTSPVNLRRNLRKRLDRKFDPFSNAARESKSCISIIDTPTYEMGL